MVDGPHQEVEHLLRGRQVWGVPAFITDGRDVPRLGEQLLERVKRFGRPADRFGHIGRAGRHEHEFLEVERVGRMRAAVQHVDRGNR